MEFCHHADLELLTPWADAAGQQRAIRDRGEEGMTR